jgi:hypothetical protein
MPLVIVSCGRSKIWDGEPDRSPVAAAEGSTGRPFRINRQNAERFGDAWVVLSAKYGFIAPDFMIAGSYEVSFKHPATSPIAFDRLRQQVREQQLGHDPVVVGLGARSITLPSGQPSRTPRPASSFFPVEGLSLGTSLQATKYAIGILQTRNVILRLAHLRRSRRHFVVRQRMRAGRTTPAAPCAEERHAP